MAESIKNKIKTIMREQKVCPQYNLPKIASVFEKPRVTTHGLGRPVFVAANDAHNRNTNNGYKRGTGGAFYCH